MTVNWHTSRCTVLTARRPHLVLVFASLLTVALLLHDPSAQLSPIISLSDAQCVHSAADTALASTAAVTDTVLQTMVCTPIKTRCYVIGQLKTFYFSYKSTGTGIALTTIFNHPSFTVVSATWSGNNQIGAYASGSSEGAILSRDAKTLYQQSKTYGWKQDVGDVQEIYGVQHTYGGFASDPCSENSIGATARVLNVRSAAVFKDSSETSFLIASFDCHVLALVSTTAPYSVSWAVGDGTNAELDGYGRSARIRWPGAMARWHSKIYLQQYNALKIIIPDSGFYTATVTKTASPQQTSWQVMTGSQFQYITISGSGYGSNILRVWNTCHLVLSHRTDASVVVYNPDEIYVYMLEGDAATANIGSGANKAATFGSDPDGFLWPLTPNVPLRKIAVTHTGCTSPLAGCEATTSTRSFSPTQNAAGVARTKSQSPSRDTRSTSATRTAAATATVPVPPTPTPPTPSPPSPAPPSPAPITPSPPTPSPPSPAPITPSPPSPAPITPSPPTPSPLSPAPPSPAPITPSPPTPSPLSPAPPSPVPMTSSPPTPLPATLTPATLTPATQAPVTPTLTVQPPSPMTQASSPTVGPSSSSIPPTVPPSTTSPSSETTDTTSSSSSSSECHLAQTEFQMSGTQRHRVVVDYNTKTSPTFSSCTMSFTCADSTSSGLAFKITKSVPTGKLLSVMVNTTQVVSGASPAVGSGVSRMVPEAGEINGIINTQVYSLTVIASGSGGSVALQASCVPSSLEVPPNHADVNSIITTEAPPSEVSTLLTYQSSWKQFTKADTRRSYGVNEKRAFLISCATSDMTTDNKVVRIEAITGSTGSPADTLTVLAADSSMVRSFSGANISYHVNTNGSTPDTMSFDASSQYYVVWTSDSIPDDMPAVGGVSVSYSCGNGTWQTTSEFTSSGAGGYRALVTWTVGLVLVVAALASSTA